jgi:putative Holliday junction resolvase
MPRILGIDLGLKRTGLAISDEIGLTAKALPLHRPGNRDQDVAYILDLAKKNSVTCVVIGYALLPHSKEEGFMARRAKGFAVALEKTAQQHKIDLEIHLVEEAFTSKEANIRLIELGMAPKERKLALDGEVARMLVLDFARTRGGGL